MRNAEITRRSLGLGRIAVAHGDELDAVRLHVPPRIQVILRKEAATDQRTTHTPCFPSPLMGAQRFMAKPSIDDKPIIPESRSRLGKTPAFSPAQGLRRTSGPGTLRSAVMTEPDPIAVNLGAISLMLDANGNSARAISVNGEEVFRGIGFVVRDANWGTPHLPATADVIRSADLRPAPRPPAISRSKAMGSIGRSTGRSRPASSWAGAVTSHTGFSTNRTGFVVLHSLGAARGQAVAVGHSDSGRPRRRASRISSRRTSPSSTSPGSTTRRRGARRCRSASSARSSRSRISATGPMRPTRPIAGR